MLLCVVKVHLELKLSLVINANDIVIQCSVMQTIKEEKEKEWLEYHCTPIAICILFRLVSWCDTACSETVRSI